MVKLKILESSNDEVNETELQGLFEKNLEAIEEGLKHVGSYVQVGTGIIDILAIDESNNPVIIECKKVGNFDRDALIQLMKYYSWFSTDENHIRILKSIFNKKGFSEITQNIRLMAIVSDISDDVKNACYAITPNIMLVSFSLYKSDNDGEIIVTPKILLDTSVGGSVLIREPKSENDHFKNNPQMRPLYEKLKASILQIDDKIKLNPSPQDYIGFVAKKNFCGVHIKKNWIRLDLLLTADEAKNPKYFWNEKWGEYGYYRLENESKLEEAIELIKKSLEKASS